MAKCNQREFDSWDDDDLKENIIEKYGYFNHDQYEFSRRLKTIIMDRNYTGITFAKYVGLSNSTISLYVNGKRMPRTNELKIIANKLNVPIDYLLGKNDCLSYSAQEINKIIGLSENAMKTLAMLNHNIEEIQDLMDPMEVSNVHKNKLDILSSFMEDISNFSMFLTQIESYVRIRQKIKETEDKAKKELLEYDLIRN